MYHFPVWWHQGLITWGPDPCRTGDSAGPACDAASRSGGRTDGRDRLLCRAKRSGASATGSLGAVRLTPALPAMWAEGIARRILRGQGLGSSGASRQPAVSLPVARRRARALVARLRRRGVIPPLHGRPGAQAGTAAPTVSDRSSPVPSSSAPFSPVPPFQPVPPADDELFWRREDVWALAEGRRLLPGELYRLLRRTRGLSAFREDLVSGELVALTRGLFRLARQGLGTVEAGLLWRRDETVECARCGEEQVVAWPCSRCGGLCLECETCAALGPIRACDVLFTGVAAGPGDAGVTSSITGSALYPDGADSGVSHVRRAPEAAVPPSKAYAPPIVADARRTGTAVPPSVRGLPFPLSPAQREAARQVLDFLRRPEKEALLWAACGAGKTEVAFAAVTSVLQQGRDVLFTVPRRDVAAELARRLAAYVAPYPVEAYYGGAPPARGDLPPSRDLPRLVVATTHQLLRFGPVFSFVILDEVDAFPYAGEPFLRRGLRRATAPGGKTLMMTATPDRPLLAAARRGSVRLITIPARHHGHPLPVPEWVRVGSRLDPFLPRSPEDGDPLPPRVRALLQRCVRRGPTLVFVPTVRQAEKVGRTLQSNPLGPDHLPEERAHRPLPGDPWVHSRDPRRDEKIEAFRRGLLPVLVTTTVLERGVTVPSAQIVVLDADRDDIWDERALVQMAGRAGRSADDPRGLVYFVSRRRTRAMETAVAQIRELNARARRLGFLKGEGGDDDVSA